MMCVHEVHFRAGIVIEYSGWYETVGCKDLEDQGTELLQKRSRLVDMTGQEMVMGYLGV